MKVVEVKDTDRGGKPMAGLKMLRGQGPERPPTQPRETPGDPHNGGHDG